MKRVRARHLLAGLSLLAPLPLAIGCSFDDGGLTATEDAGASADDGSGDGPRDVAQDRPGGGADRPVDAPHAPDAPAPDAPRAEAGAKLANGAACGGPTACASNFCVDGVCCEFLCAGLCQSCVKKNTGQPDGLCRPMPVGTDPDNECPDEGAASCRRDGTCDGLGACRVYAVNTACSAPVCKGGTRTPPRRCNGAGSCLDAPPDQPCPDGLVCDNATTCKTKCAGKADCAADHSCIDGTCKPVQPNGKTCDVGLGGADCQSGHCADGVCCDLPCTGFCRACTAAKTGQADGKCANVTAGTDPDNECKADDPATCGNDGTCDGMGGCRKYANGAACGAACCGNGRRCARVCHDGACVDTDAQVENCGGNACCCPDGGGDGKAVCGPKSMCPQTCQ